MKIVQLMRLACLFGVLGALTACASTADRTPGDPLEPLNRRVFAVNEALDQSIIVPATKAYVWLAPGPTEEAVANAFRNIDEPVSAVNSLLQGKPGEATKTVVRFGLNSTIGVLGLFDVATGMGLERRDEDFGQTFAKWGIDNGPYLVLPLLGPTTLRDGVGRAAASPASPGSWLADDQARSAFTAANVLNTSANLLEARGLVSGDKYLFLRDAYLQQREFAINDGAIEEEDPFLDD